MTMGPHVARVTLCAALLAGTPAPADEPSQVRVSAAVANVRAEASSRARVLFQVRAGQVLKVAAVEGDWYRVETADGRRGYLSKTVAAPVAAAAAPDPEPAAPPAVSGMAIEHEGVACVVAGRFTRIAARAEPADRVARARVYFRAAGHPAWYHVAMVPAQAGLAGILPKARKDTTRVEYYVEVLGRDLGEGRTREYAPPVVADPGGCSRTLAAAFLTAAKVAVGSPPGAPPLPPGFEPAGVVAEGASTTAGGAEKRFPRTALLIGGGAVVVGGVVLAAGGGDGAAGPDQPAAVFSNARFNPASVTCTSTAGRGGFFLATIFVDVTNRGSQDLTITSASDVLTFVSVTPGAGNAVGESISQANLRFSPASVPASGAATIQLDAPLSFRSPSTCSAFSGSSQLQAQLTIVTSAGTFNVQTGAPLSLVYP
jgi:hypothetical protein